ncbi:MAG: LptA/OstA family protein [Synergistaceae bacterium]|nr:LptA/OstA family protein [Synergistaceae bacterium]
MIRKCVFIFISFILLFQAAAVAGAVQSSLTADNITYDVNTKKTTAKGNVVIKREGAVLCGSEADGNLETSEFNLRGSVSGDFPEQKAKLTSNSVKWTKLAKAKEGVVEAFGNVHITRQPADKLDAEYVRWETGTSNYMARDKVDGVIENKLLRAAEAGRTDKTFWGRKVIRYEDRVQKTGLAADVVDGTLENNLIQDAVATGSVKMDYIDKEGLLTVVTAERAVYSKKLGTVVLTGRPYAVRSDGKTISANKMVLHENTKNIEAIGNSKITFVTVDKNKPQQESTNKKKGRK